MGEGPGRLGLTEKTRKGAVRGLTGGEGGCLLRDGGGSGHLSAAYQHAGLWCPRGTEKPPRAE